jgi:fructose-1,6-bisphosphatase
VCFLQQVCKWACSEEVPEPVDCEGEGFSVAFDPLDGSSIVDTNFTVGTIFGVWPGDKLKGITGREQVSAAGVARQPHGVAFMKHTKLLRLVMGRAHACVAMTSRDLARRPVCTCSLPDRTTRDSDVYHN